MEIMLLIISLSLVLIVFIALKISARLSAINDSLNKTWPAVNAMHYYLTENQNERLQEVASSAEDLSLNIALIKEDIHEIKYVMDIIYKYKLPSKEERKLLDRIAIDRESGF